MRAAPMLDASLRRSEPPRPPRRFGFTTFRDIRCARGHHIREDAFVFDHGALRCKHREPLRGAPGQRAGHGGECGALVYVLACAGWTPIAQVAAQVAPKNDELQHMLLFTAEVTYEELNEMRRRRLTEPAAVLDFLGVRFPTADR